jgi:hypothetical protein
MSPHHSGYANAQINAMRALKLAAGPQVPVRPEDAAKWLGRLEQLGEGTE